MISYMFVVYLDPNVMYGHFEAGNPGVQTPERSRLAQQIKHRYAIMVLGAMVG